MSRISLDQANRMIEAAFAKGNELGLKPLCVAVLDAGGHLIALQRQDGASILRPQVATGKAAGALALGMSSRRIGEVVAERPAFIASIGMVAPQGIVPAAGGVILVDSDGLPIGAIGTTGDTSDNDELCTMAGIAAAGLTPQS
ncbi:heme-binding protein [Niveispirillum sp.]|uniref:GlcG/HbpS family heme-binding protein n=1 Tax=Niveispirillum sp. TaxID=1917217 RepID=UPI001B7816CD|nr:heme-binding protein [Niveispirillum sp.]MBP7335965.1 heme-binding protein [Niveispirillum sp.]